MSCRGRETWWRTGWRGRRRLGRTAGRPNRTRNQRWIRSRCRGSSAMTCWWIRPDPELHCRRSEFKTGRFCSQAVKQRREEKSRISCEFIKLICLFIRAKHYDQDKKYNSQNKVIKLPGKNKPQNIFIPHFTAGQSFHNNITLLLLLLYSGLFSQMTLFS